MGNLYFFFIIFFYKTGFAFFIGGSGYCLENCLVLQWLIRFDIKKSHTYLLIQCIDLITHQPLLDQHLIIFWILNVSPSPQLQVAASDLSFNLFVANSNIWPHISKITSLSKS